jgi:hypothetical protein
LSAHEASKAEVGAQDVGQDVLVLGGLGAVDQVQGSHDRGHAAVLRDHAELPAVGFPERLLVHGHVVGRAVPLHAVAHVVDRGRGDVSLDTHGHGRAQTADVEGILAIALLRAPPQWMAGQIHGRGKQHRLLGGLHLVSDGLADGVFQVEVEGRAARHADRKCRREADRVAVDLGSIRFDAVHVLGEVHAARSVSKVETANRLGVAATLDVAQLGLAGAAVGHASHLVGLVG